jgi:UDP-galactopyranose mutase
METVNVLCNQHLQTEDDMKEWLHTYQVKYDEIKNSEQSAKARIGETLYHQLIESYTIKQWNKTPAELDKSVLERIPVRCNHDTRYFSDKYQMIPEKGYTAFVHAMLDHPLIQVQLETDYESVREKYQPEWVIYTGPIDIYFASKGYPSLEYRSIDFEITRLENVGRYQPNVVVNEPHPSVAYTRTVEYKHLPYSSPSPHTTIVREYSSDRGEPYYPVPNERNMNLYLQYQVLAEEEEKQNVLFVGRLANYKYKNMNEAILDALELFDCKILKK